MSVHPRTDRPRPLLHPLPARNRTRVQHRYDRASGLAFTETTVSARPTHAPTSAACIVAADARAQKRNAAAASSRPRGALSLLQLAHRSALCAIAELTPAHLAPLPWHLARALWDDARRLELADTRVWAAFLGAHRERTALRVWTVAVAAREQGLQACVARIEAAPLGLWVTRLTLAGAGVGASRGDVVALGDMRSLVALTVVNGEGEEELVDDTVVRNWMRRHRAGGGMARLSQLTLLHQDVTLRVPKLLGDLPSLERVEIVLRGPRRAHEEAGAECEGWSLCRHSELSEDVLPDGPVLQYYIGRPAHVLRLDPRPIVSFTRTLKRTDSNIQEVMGAAATGVICVEDKRISMAGDDCPSRKRRRTRQQKCIDYEEMLS